MPDFSARPLKYSGNPIIPLGGASSYREVMATDPWAMIDPWDAEDLILLFSAVAAGAGVINSIGMFRGSVADPYESWTEVGQVLTAGSSGAWDEGGVRLGKGVYEDGLLYVPYAGFGNDNLPFAIGLAMFDGDTWSKHEDNPILTPDGQGRDDGDRLDCPVITTEGSAKTLTYSYYNGEVTLPGYRYATATEWNSWTKAGSGDVLTLAPRRAEQHQRFKEGGTYWLINEAGSLTEPYRIYAYTSPTPAAGPWTPSPFNPLLKESGIVDAIDRYHVSTPCYLAAGGRRLMFYSPGGDVNQPYYENTWPLSVATYVERPARGGSIFRM
jgi:hypothetical protein